MTGMFKGSGKASVAGVQGAGGEGSGAQRGQGCGQVEESLWAQVETALM